MKKFVIVLVLVLLASIFAVGQEKGSVFGGYQYLSIDTQDSGVGRQSAHGWNTDVAARVAKNVSIVGDISGNYKTIDGIKVNAYNFLFGPRISASVGKVTPFAEVLVGVAHASFSQSGVSLGSKGFAFALGGGLDVNASKHVAVRLAKFDYVRDHISNDLVGSTNLNNYRYATGIVFKF